MTSLFGSLPLCFVTACHCHILTMSNNGGKMRSTRLLGTRMTRKAMTTKPMNISGA